MQSYLSKLSSNTGVSIASNKECKGIGGSLEEEVGIGNARTRKSSVRSLV